MALVVGCVGHLPRCSLADINQQLATTKNRLAFRVHATSEGGERVVRKKRSVTKAINRNAISTHRQAIRKSAEPEFIEPMQCKAVTSLPTDEKWTFEIKFDGYRCVAVARTRHHAILAPQEVLTRRFPNVVQAIASLKDDFVLDGELVALDSQGRPSFQLMQNSI